MTGDGILWVRRSGSAVTMAERFMSAGADHVRTATGVVVTYSTAGGCTAPKGMEWFAARQLGNSLTARLVARCRQCDNCVQRRRREWVARALREVAHSEASGRRVWFVTLTLHPDWRQHLTHLFHVKQTPWAKPMNPRSHRMATLSDWLTAYLKRVRDHSAAQFRYLAALEEHADGEFHIHVLVHEYLGQIGERDFRNSWKPAGFVQAKLLRTDDRSARRVAIYIAKYMTKERGFPRQRCSLGYGLGGSANAERKRKVPPGGIASPTGAA